MYKTYTYCAETMHDKLKCMTRERDEEKKRKFALNITELINLV